MTTETAANNEEKDNPDKDDSNISSQDSAEGDTDSNGEDQDNAKENIRSRSLDLVYGAVCKAVAANIPITNTFLHKWAFNMVENAIDQWVSMNVFGWHDKEEYITWIIPISGNNNQL